MPLSSSVSRAADNTRVTDPFGNKIVKWIERFQGRIRADRVYEELWPSAGWSAPPGAWRAQSAK